MSTASEKMIQAIEHVVKPLSVGTNIALLHLIWAMVSGAFLQSRGALHTAVKMSGRTDKETRRSGDALRTGQWQISELIGRWREWVLNQKEWEPRTHEGWQAVSCDVVVFPRLKLKGWVATLYRGTFGRAVKAVGLGIIVDVGQCGGGRVALLRQIVRCRNSKESEKQLQAALLVAGGNALGERGVFVHDAGVSVKAVQQAGVKRFVIRLAKNCVARWPELPEKAHGNRQYGGVIRPLARVRDGKTTAATNDPTLETSFQYKGRTIRAQQWHGVVGADVKVSDGGEQYDIWVFLTPNIRSRFFWQSTLRRKPRRFFSSTVTAGRWSSCRWQPSR